MTIRALEHHDVDAAVAIIADNYPDTIQYVIDAQAEMLSTFVEYPVQPRCVVAEDAGHIIGVGMIAPSWTDYHMWEIFWINIHSKHQSKGVGTALIHHLMQLATHDGVHTVILSTQVPNFYLRLGFTQLLSMPDGWTLMSKVIHAGH